MAKIPKKPEEVFAEFTADFRQAFGPDLVSITLYGSGARHDYIPGKSDINFLVVLSEEGINSLEKAFGVLPGWRKKRVAVPLFMTKSFILSSVDSYPIEFFNMKRHYIQVFGEDVLKDLVFSKPFLRLQSERELKGKLLLLRTRYLETEGKVDRIEHLIRESITAFISIFNALLVLKDAQIPHGRSEVVKALAEVFAFNPEPLLRCVGIKEGRKAAATEVESVFRDYLKELALLADLVNGMEL
jgi:predicted nucleotidyltransferase